MKTTGKLLRDNLIQLDTIICLHGCWSNVPEQLQEIFEWGEDDDKAVLKQAGFSEEEIEELYEDFDKDSLAETMEHLELCGFLIKAYIPSPDDTRIENGKPTHGTYTWGISQWKWFYAETVEAAIPHILAWKDQKCLEAHNTAKN